ncbi:MAG: trypsin-like serine protease [Pseudomonadota bacterium]
MRAHFAALAALLSFTSPVFGINVQDSFANGTRYESDPVFYAAVLGYAPVFDGVAFVAHQSGSLCSGALISRRSVLTGRHCTDGLVAQDWRVSFATGGQVVGYDVSSVASLSANPLEPDNYFNGTDLAVLTLATDVANIMPFEILANPTVGEPVTMLGWGLHGTGSTGASSIDGLRRMAKNEIDVIAAGYDGNSLLYADFDKEDGSENTTETVLGFVSSETGTDLEGLISNGDSGGPLLYEREDRWVLGGIATGVNAFDGLANSDYGDLGIWTGFRSDAARTLLSDAGASFYTTSTPPLPAPVFLPAPIFSLASALLGLGLLRHLSRRKQAPT